MDARRWTHGRRWVGGGGRGEHLLRRMWGEANTADKLRQRPALVSSCASSGAKLGHLIGGGSEASLPAIELSSSSDSSLIREALSGGAGCTAKSLVGAQCSCKARAILRRATSTGAAAVSHASKVSESARRTCGGAGKPELGQARSSPVQAAARWRKRGGPAVRTWLTHLLASIAQLHGHIPQCHQRANRTNRGLHRPRERRR